VEKEALIGNNTSCNLLVTGTEGKIFNICESISQSNNVTAPNIIYDGKQVLKHLAFMRRLGKYVRNIVKRARHLERYMYHIHKFWI
jgi:uncharacterized protein (UPF0333 family)